jgi:prepilin-type N-terminal cleavage/methylation domain-containing protein
MPHQAQAGFSLVELSIGLIVVGVLTAAAINGVGGLLQARMVQLSNARLAAAGDALTLFVTRNKRLPCPADGTLPDTSSTAGTEAFADGVTSTNCAAGTSMRVLPWRALGLGAADAKDGFAHRLTYRTQDGATGLTQPGGMDMSATNPAANDNTSPLAWLTGKGLTILDASGTPILSPALPNAGGGAAYVLMSNGHDGAGAYSASGTLLPLPTQAGRLADATATTSFTLTPPNNTTGSPLFFDYIIAAPSVHAVATAAGLGPE